MKIGIPFLQKSDPGDSFWKWFSRNRRKLEIFIDSDLVDFKIYNELTGRLNKFNHFLVPELTKNEDGDYVLVISPDGRRQGLEATKRLYALKQDFENWKVIKFRQPLDTAELRLDSISYPSSDIEILPEIDQENNKVNLRLFIRNMNCDPKAYQSLAFLYLDHIIGEFNTLTRVGYIDFYHLDEDKVVVDSITLIDLRRLIESNLY